MIIQDPELNKIIARILPLIGADADDFEQMRATLLSSEPAWPGENYTPQTTQELAKFIDHTLLASDATDAQVERLCSESVAAGFASVCVNSCHIKRCVEMLNDADVKICSVVGFPLGAMATEAKAAEAQYASDAGAHEVDMVPNIGRFLSGEDGLLYTFRDITAVRQAAWGCSVKVILETSLLSPQQIVEACAIAVMGGANFVKTSTGFSKSGATTDAVQLMRRVVGRHIGVKASGGIRGAQTALTMIQSGANRIGTSSGLAIVSDSIGKSDN